MPVAEGLVARLKKIQGVKEIAFAGSLRRGKETIGDIDILVAADDSEAVRSAFVSMPEVEKVLANGETRSSVRLRVGSDLSRWSSGDDETQASGGAVVQVDLRLVPRESWGAALLYFTGSKDHNVRLRERALKQKLTLNEYGLYPLDDRNEPPQRRGVKAVAGKTEEEIYTKLKLSWVPPEIREDRGELEVRETPALIELGDIKAELHAHTTESDGALSLEELVAEAKKRGFHTIGVTDHSKSSIQANGLSVERVKEQIKRVHDYAKGVKGISVLVGSEVDILADGTLDYDDKLLAQLDIVVASPHSALKQDPKKATARLLKAIEHPLVHVLGHPTGRLINRRPGLEPAMDELIAAAVEHETALEINAHWMRLDLRDTHVRAAVEAGALIAIDCDVHTLADFDNLRYGVMTGRRGWLTADQCVNTWSRQKLAAWLKRKR
jgi:DNA polymerase (family 10)